MASEVVVTSAPRGVKLGRTGFQVVMRTAGMREDVTGTLEQLGDYRHVHPQGSGRNPTIYTFRRVRSFVGELSALVRSVDAGNDFSGRSNKLTHVVALAAAEVNALARATPPALLRALESDGTLVSAWPGGPEERPSGPRLPSIASEARRCDRWAEQTGDAGWAGAIAERALRGAATLVVAPDCSPASSRMVLDLFDEVYALLPPSRRWEIPFDTTLMAAGSPATLRGTYAGSPESATPGTALVVELAGRPPIPPEFETSDLVATARTGAARSGPATGRASSGPRPPGPLPVPGGPPFGPPLGHPEGSDPLGFDNLPSGPQTGPPPIPGCPPPPPVPTGAIGRGCRTMGGDEDARPRGRNPVVIPVAIVLTLLIMLTLGIGVYAGIKLRERKNAIKNLSEIAKAEPAAAGNAGEDAPKPTNTPDDLVRKALWPNTDWWYFPDPVHTNPERAQKLVGLLPPNETLTHRDLLRVWKQDVLPQVAAPPVATIAANQAGQTTRSDDAPQEPARDKPSGPRMMPEGQAPSKSRPASASASAAQDKAQPSDALTSLMDYSEQSKTNPGMKPPTANDWWDAFPNKQFLQAAAGMPQNRITIRELSNLLNSYLRESKDIPRDKNEFASTLETIVHDVLNLFKKCDSKQQVAVIDDHPTSGFVRVLKSLGLTASQDQHQAFQARITAEIRAYVEPSQSADETFESKYVKYISQLDLQKIRALLAKPIEPSGPTFKQVVDGIDAEVKKTSWTIEGKTALLVISAKEWPPEMTIDVAAVEPPEHDDSDPLLWRWPQAASLSMNRELRQIRIDWVTEDTNKRKDFASHPISIGLKAGSHEKELWIPPLPLELQATTSGSMDDLFKTGKALIGLKEHPTGVSGLTVKQPGQFDIRCVYGPDGITLTCDPDLPKSWTLAALNEYFWTQVGISDDRERQQRYLKEAEALIQLKEPAYKDGCKTVWDTLKCLATEGHTVEPKTLRSGLAGTASVQHIPGKTTWPNPRILQLRRFLENEGSDGPFLKNWLAKFTDRFEKDKDEDGGKASGRFYHFVRSKLKERYIPPSKPECYDIKESQRSAEQSAEMAEFTKREQEYKEKCNKFFRLLFEDHRDVVREYLAIDIDKDKRSFFDLVLAFEDALSTTWEKQKSRSDAVRKKQLTEELSLVLEGSWDCGARKSPVFVVARVVPGGRIADTNGKVERNSDTEHDTAGQRGDVEASSGDGAGM